MSITGFSQERAGDTTIVTVVSDLTGLVFYHWYMDGAYVATTTAPTYTFTLDVGEQVRIDVVDTNDAELDPLDNAPAGYPARVSLWWTRSESLDAVHYRVVQVRPQFGGEETIIAEIPATADQWSFSLLTPRLNDGQEYQWWVYPYDTAGNQGTRIRLIPLSAVLRTPDAPNFSATYAAGTQRVTFAAA
jgi:hypothetical protein